MSKLMYFFDACDANYLPMLKPLLEGHIVHLSSIPPTTLIEIVISAKKRGVCGVICSQQALLRKLLSTDPDTSASNAAKATLDDYAGSILVYQKVEFLIVNPIEHLVTVPYARHLFKRYFSKLLAPNRWFPVPKFSWELAKESKTQEIFDSLAKATYIAVDIETVKEGLIFDCISFCGVWIDSKRRSITMHTYVYTNDSEYNYQCIKNLLENTNGQKIFQNGKYDNAYLLRFGICTYNWLWDTAHLFHSWYSELPKRLDFIVSYCLRDAKFWKDDHQGGDYIDRLRYNARDSWNTACAFLSLIEELPEWAIQNYLMEFPLVFACLMSEMTGLKVDLAAFEKMKAALQTRVAAKLAQFQVEVGVPNFNPNSSTQVKLLMKALGSGDLKGSDKVSMDQFKNRHPLNELIADRIKDIRADNKVISSYLKDGIFFTDNKTIKGYPRILYCLNPHGTDTGRLASKEHHFWCGLQIHNIKRDDDDFAQDIGNVKDTIIADDGFLLGECDYEQAEARDTGYLSGDTALIAAVDGDRDFHSVNASAFFGISYEQIYSDALHKAINKVIRDLAKRTNHGANYNMRARMLLMTMGIKNVANARRALGLSYLNLLQVCQFLLDRFDATYPIVRGKYQDDLKYVVATQHMLTGPTGWTRYCFGDPVTNRSVLNSLVAHKSQSLNAMTLNKAYNKVFLEIALPNYNNFKLCAQIHDSIIFQYRKGYEHLALAVRDAMIIPTPVTDIFGITRILTVPAALKWNASRWSELEDCNIKQATSRKLLG